MKKFIAAAMLSSVLSGAAARAVDAAPPTTQPAAKTRMLVVRADGDASTTQPSITIQDGAIQLDRVYSALAANIQSKTEKAAWLGVATSRPPLSLMKQLKLKCGLVVDQVVADSPAAAAGLKPQDLIEKLDDQLLINPAQLEALVRMHKPGDNIALTILHEGDRSSITAKLVEHDVLAMQDEGAQTIQVSPMTVQTFAAPANATPGVQADTRIMTFGDGNGGPNGQGSSSFQSQFSDGTHELTISGHDGHKTLVIKDSSGKELFNGPIDTPQQQDKIPQDLLPKFQQMQKISSMTEKLPTP